MTIDETSREEGPKGMKWVYYKFSMSYENLNEDFMSPIFKIKKCKCSGFELSLYNFPIGNFKKLASAKHVAELIAAG